MESGESHGKVIAWFLDTAGFTLDTNRNFQTYNTLNYDSILFIYIEPLTNHLINYNYVVLKLR